MTTRIYAVDDEINKTTHLVEATSQGQSIAAVTRPHYKARIPKATEVVQLMQAGVKVVKAEAVDAEV